MKFKTSGSTGKSKTFELTSEQLDLRAHTRGIAKGEEFKQLKSLFCDLSLKSTAGYTYWLWCLKNKVNFYTPRTMNLLQSSTQVDGLISSLPMLLKYSNMKMPREFKYILASGYRATLPVIHKVRNTLKGRLFISYGASEVGSIAITNIEQILQTPNCVGKLCPGVEVKFDNQNQILVKTTTMISGYDDPRLTQRYFQNGWFLTGDVGKLETGLLLVMGRLQKETKIDSHS
jgi:acyl-CoA synthetase (AMP-forming)/AMP-acid ligase II